MLGRHINILLQVKELGPRMSDRDLAAKAGIPFFTVKKYRSQERHFTKERLMELLELEKSLVYFTTSLRSNEAVLEKLI